MSMRRRLLLLAVLSSVSASRRPAHAQTRTADSAFADLRTDGNGIPALAAHTAVAFASTTAEAAFRALADQARLNLTLDPGLHALESRITIPAHERTIAAALLEIADATGLRVRVSRAAQLVVLAAPPIIAQRVRAADTARSPVSLPAVRTEAERVERRQFETTATLGQVSITRAALAATPVFVEPDVMRSVQTLPGIASRSDYTAAFNVRGGEGDQNLTLLDGYPIYNPFHLAGVFSTFIDATVGRVDLRTGSLPADYGGRLSGVLDVQSAEPTRSELHGTADVSLASTSASIGSATADGKATWMIAGRHTYADVIANAIKPNSFPYHFQDAQAHAAYTFANRLRVSVTAYAGEDASTPHNTDDFGMRWGNSVVGVTVSKQFDGGVRLFGQRVGDSLRIEQRLSLTRFDARMDAPDELLHLRNSAFDPRAAGSISLYGDHATHTIGYEVQTERLSYQLSSPDNDLLDFLPLDSIAHAAHSASVYLDETIRPSPRWLVEAGARVDATSTGWSGVSPRLAAKYFLRPATAITAATGRYAQWIHALARDEELVQPLQFWVVPAASMPVSRATDGALGLEEWLSPSRVLHVEAFYKRYNDLLITNGVSDPNVPAMSSRPPTEHPTERTCCCDSSKAGRSADGWRTAMASIRASRRAATGIRRRRIGATI